MEENKETESENKEKTEKKQGTKRKSTGTSKKASTSNTKTTAKTTATKKNVAKKSTVAKTTTKKADSATKVSSAKTPRKTSGVKKATSAKEKDVSIIDEKADVIKEEKPELKIEKDSKEVKKEENKPNSIKVENDKKQEKEEKIDKKQEASKHAQNGKDKKVKKHKVLRMILLILVVLLILFSIHFYRNYKIINELLSKMKVIENTSNYSYRTEYYTTNDTNQRDFIEHYYKDDKMMLVKNSDDGKIIIWYDRLSGESVFLSPQTLTATTSKESELYSLFDAKPLGGLYYAEQCTRGLDFLYLITQDTVNGQECYKVNWLGQICWYNKENGLLVKTLNSKTVIDGKEYDSITEWKNWEIGNLTDEDVSKPNLIGYTVNRAD